jgi:hypothetical protein
MSDQPGAEHLKKVQDELVARGVRGVSFTLAPDAHKQPLDKVMGDAARLLQAYLDGKTKLVAEYKPMPDDEFLRQVVSKPIDAVSALEFMRLWQIAVRVKHLEEENTRLKEIEHQAWHLLDDSEERVTEDEFVVTRVNFEALSKLLPEDHP